MDRKKLLKTIAASSAVASGGSIAGNVAASDHKEIDLDKAPEAEKHQGENKWKIVEQILSDPTARQIIRSMFSEG